MNPMWNDIETLQRIAKFTPYVFIVLGFVVAISGQFVRTRIDERVRTLKTKAEIDRKLTPPDIDADIALALDTKKYAILSKSKNLIPFKASWMALNDKKEVLSGIMLGEEDFVPDASRSEFIYKLEVQEDRIHDNYLELQFRWHSAFFAEMGNPEKLKGAFTKQYRLINRVPHPLKSP